MAGALTRAALLSCAAAIAAGAGAVSASSVAVHRPAGAPRPRAGGASTASTTPTTPGCYSPDCVLTFLARPDPCLEDYEGTEGSIGVSCGDGAWVEYGRLYKSIDGPRTLTHLRTYVITDCESTWGAMYTVYETASEADLKDGKRGTIIWQSKESGLSCFPHNVSYYKTISIPPGVVLEDGKNYYASVLVMSAPGKGHVFVITPENWLVNEAPTYWFAPDCGFGLISEGPKTFEYWEQIMPNICDGQGDASNIEDGGCAGLIDLISYCRPDVHSDPHFLGLDGRAYDVTGAAGTVYSIVSNAGLAVNALFSTAYTTGLDAATGLRYHARGTWITAIGIVTPGGLATVFANGTVWDWDTEGGPGIEVDASEWPRVVVWTEAADIQITLVPPPDEWGVPREEAAALTHLNVEFSRAAFTRDVHGLLGASARRDASKGRAAAAHYGADGEGVLEGGVAEYAVEGLLATRFKYSAFSGADQE